MRDLQTGFGLMIGFIAHLHNVLLHFTNRCMTHYVFSSPPPSIANSVTLNPVLCCNCNLFIFSVLNSRLTVHVVLRNLTDFNHLLCVFITSRHGPQHRKHSSSIVACIRFSGNVFTQLFHSNDCKRHISYRDNSSIVLCGHYLATAVSPQFLL
jgi:hypothetical protein